MLRTPLEASGATRGSVRVTLTEGDGGTSHLPTKKINVVAVNDAPVIGAFDPAITYTASGAAVVLDTNATVADGDSSNFDTGNLTISLTANAQATDLVEIRNQGIAAGQIGVSGSVVPCLRHEMLADQSLEFVKALHALDFVAERSEICQKLREETGDSRKSLAFLCGS